MVGVIWLPNSIKMTEEETETFLHKFQDTAITQKLCFEVGIALSKYGNYEVKITEDNDLHVRSPKSNTAC